MTLITERVGDIFSAPPCSVLIHACNAQGVWGSGVAVAFKQNFPCAHRLYQKHCKTPPIGTKLADHQASLVGSTLLIPPPPAPVLGKAHSVQTKHEQHYIACMFTSLGYGKNKSSPEVILENTRHAVKDLARQLKVLRDGYAEKEGERVQGKQVLEEPPGECWSVRINSGMFAVPWEDTKAVLETAGLDMVVVRPEGEGR